MSDFPTTSPFEGTDDNYSTYEIGELVIFYDMNSMARTSRLMYDKYEKKIALIVSKEEWYPGCGLFRYKVVVDGELIPEFVWSGAFKKIMVKEVD
jgi:hypothetical protein